MRSRGVVLSQPFSNDTVQGAEVFASIRRFIFSSFRISNEIKELGAQSRPMALGRLSAIHLSSAYRDQLKLLMDDLGNTAGHLDSLGWAAECGPLDDLLDECNTLESLWNILEIFSINAGSHCYFEIIRWLQVHHCCIS